MAEPNHLICPGTGKSMSDLFVSVVRSLYLSQASGGSGPVPVGCYRDGLEEQNSQHRIILTAFLP